jgi:Flp pilus assembly protein TadB
VVLGLLHAQSPRQQPGALTWVLLTAVLLLVVAMAASILELSAVIVLMGVLVACLVALQVTAARRQGHPSAELNAEEQG